MAVDGGRGGEPDGVTDLEAAAEETLPGRDERVGPLCRLWREDRFFATVFLGSALVQLAGRLRASPVSST